MVCVGALSYVRRQLLRAAGSTVCVALPDPMLRVCVCVCVRSSYLDGIPGDCGTKAGAMAWMVRGAAVRAGLTGLPAKDTGLEDLLEVVSSRLQANARLDDGSTTHLFIHLDELDLSDEAVDEHYFPLTMPLSKRYYEAWRHMFAPVLRTPHVLLIVTGRPLELAMIGRGLLGPGTSPTAAHHALLGSLSPDYLDEVRSACFGRVCLSCLVAVLVCKERRWCCGVVG